MEIQAFQYIQYLSLVIAFFCMRGLRLFAMLPLLVILLIGNIADTLGAFEPAALGTKSNYWIYNCYLLLCYPAYALQFNNMLQHLGKMRRSWLIIESTGFLFILGNYLYTGNNEFHTYNLIVFCLMWVVFSCFTLLHASLDEDLSPAFLRHPYFYFCCGTLLFSLATVVILGLQRYISANELRFGSINIYRPVMFVVNIILYSLYTYTCLLCRQKNRS